MDPSWKMSLIQPTTVKLCYKCRYIRKLNCFLPTQPACHISVTSLLLICFISKMENNYYRIKCLMDWAIELIGLRIPNTYIFTKPNRYSIVMNVRLFMKTSTPNYIPAPPVRNCICSRLLTWTRPLLCRRSPLLFLWLALGPSHSCSTRRILAGDVNKLKCRWSWGVWIGVRCGGSLCLENGRVDFPLRNESTTPYRTLGMESSVYPHLGFRPSVFMYFSLDCTSPKCYCSSFFFNRGYTNRLRKSYTKSTRKKAEFWRIINDDPKRIRIRIRKMCMIRNSFSRVPPRGKNGVPWMKKKIISGCINVHCHKWLTFWLLFFRCC